MSTKKTLYKPKEIIAEYGETCPECGSQDLVEGIPSSNYNLMLLEDHAAGDMVCSQCGVIVADRIVDMEREWREFESDTSSKQKYVFFCKRLLIIVGVVLVALQIHCWSHQRCRLLLEKQVC